MTHNEFDGYENHHNPNFAADTVKVELYTEILEENARQIRELEKIVDPSDRRSPKSMRARVMMAELREDSQWRRDEIARMTGVGL